MTGHCNDGVFGSNEEDACRNSTITCKETNKIIRYPFGNHLRSKVVIFSAATKGEAMWNGAYYDKYKTNII